jgi:hypothetical protein
MPYQKHLAQLPLLLQLLQEWDNMFTGGERQRRRPWADANELSGSSVSPEEAARRQWKQPQFQMPVAAAAVKWGSSARRGGTQFVVPSNKDMRAARHKLSAGRHLIAIADHDVDACIGVLEAVLLNIRAARVVRPRQGRPPDTHTLRRVLIVLKKARLPLRAWVDPDRKHQYKPAAQRLIERELKLSPQEAIGALRRLSSLRAQLPKEWLTY